nr:hypothetical protein CFP56_28473 [Quercus suber]
MDPFMPEHRRESSCKESDLTYWPGSREDTGVESHWGGLEASSPSSATIGADPPRYSTEPGSGHESQLLISAPEVQRDGELALEEQLHNKHHGNLKSYVERLSEQMGEGQRFTRAQWLTHDTVWARIWCPDRSPGVGRARCEDDADVLCYTAAQFNAHADTAQQFGRPIIIKQDFSDHSMHSIPHFLTMLQDSCHHGMLDVRGLDSKVPMSMLTEQFVNAAQTPSNGGHGGLAVLNLPNLTKAHRPLFTMLPRFQLLETLTKRLCKGTSRRISSLSIDPSACVDFNVIRLAEAFSGADMNSVSGTWFRILDGTEYWMIVSAVEMDLEWDNFASEGDEWLPHGKERLIVLEKGDVLLMPPGCPIVHAVHSPSGSLVEGGSLWDEHNMISTLQSVLEACGSQSANNKILNLPLARIMDNLRELVSTHPNKFQGSLDRANMLSIIDKTVLALRDTDYICIDPL